VLYELQYSATADRTTGSLDVLPRTVTDVDELIMTRSQKDIDWIISQIAEVPIETFRDDIPPHMSRRTTCGEAEAADRDSCPSTPSIEKSQAVADGNICFVSSLSSPTMKEAYNDRLDLYNRTATLGELAESRIQIGSVSAKFYYTLWNMYDFIT
jgi:hypothetical protein